MSQDLGVVITGASDGIGRELSIAFARRGARLGLLARRMELLSSVREECLKAGSPLVCVRSVDVTDSVAQRQAFEELAREMGRLNVFVANAGVSGRSRISRDAFEENRRCIEVNVVAAMDGLEWMKERMVTQGEGILAGVSSVAATRGLPDSGAYSASKAAISTYLESLRVDLRGTGVRVVTVSPGYIDTALSRKNRGKMPFLMPAPRAAEIFAEGILRGKRHVVAPWQFGPVIFLLKILPGWLYDALLGLFMERVRGGPASDGRHRRGH